MGKVKESKHKFLIQFSAWALAPFLVTVVVDQASKILAYQGHLQRFDNPVLSLDVFRNEGVMGSLFVDLPLSIRILSLSIWGGLNIFAAFLMQFFLLSRSVALTFGIGLIAGGITGNLIDRVFRGYVVDFLQVAQPVFIPTVFNVADVIQVIGYILAAVALVKDWSKIFPDKNLRNSFWIMPEFQKRYLLKLYTMICGLAGIIGFFFFGLLTLIIDEVTASSQTKFHYILVFLISYSAILICFLALITWLGLVFSHRIAGPVYAFQRFTADLCAGKSPKLKLRDTDEFKEFEALALKLSHSMKENP